ncbi:MAG: phosphoribosylformimino-5-aminoimidazole carboxamide ribotide isomerase [Spirochaetales bacterium]|nr:phosphoribosylformimino-5-aminoimidazole carboxamide ribotide isomerase [Spirochaetales bacterium]
MKLRPCIDLHGGRVKQIVGGSLKDGEQGSAGSARENFVSDKDASWYASLYKEKNLRGGHIIKLGPGNDEQALSALKTWPGGLQIGGGINRDNASYWLEAGASHVIITSALFKDGRLDRNELEKISLEIGKDRLVLDLSCRKRAGEWFVVTDRWQTFTDFTLREESLAELSSYCDEFLIHGVDVEGMRSGIEEELVQLLSRKSLIPITYAGGIANWEDVEKMHKLGKGRIDFTVGSALDIFGGELPLEELLTQLASLDEK